MSSPPDECLDADPVPGRVQRRALLDDPALLEVFTAETEARLVEGFDHLRRDIACYIDACLALEVVARVFQPDDPHPQFLRGALAYLKLLGVGRGRCALRIHFHSQVVRAGGLAPQWGRCTECGGVAGGDQVAVRLPGGVLCDTCSNSGDERIPAGLALYLSDEARVPWGHVPGLGASEDLLERAWGLYRRLLLYHLERPPRSLRFVRD